jgi:Na+/H+ antiporter NhaD/arsenite permease-like protein
VNIWFSALVSLFLLLAAAGLMALHVRTWRRAQRQKPAARELDYRRRQFRRRMQSSALLGVLAAAIFLGPLLTEPPLAVLVFWGAALLLVCWVLLLAAADVAATKLHFGRLRADYLAQQAKLQAEIRRIRAMRGNGKPHKQG